ncbi:MAG UNVERIFIED_CONTAM: hypothetical protein LVR18_48560 [Planctomycetaceae bacterium]
MTCQHIAPLALLDITASRDGSAKGSPFSKNGSTIRAWGQQLTPEFRDRIRDGRAVPIAQLSSAL